jgi:hypothetical protein
MLRWAAVFLVIALVAALFGFTDVESVQLPEGPITDVSQPSTHHAYRTAPLPA